VKGQIETIMCFVYEAAEFVAACLAA